MKITKEMVCKGEEIDVRGRKCLISWLFTIYREKGYDLIDESLRVARSIIPDQKKYAFLSSWNDDINTTEEQIAEVINKTQELMAS